MKIAIVGAGLAGIATAWYLSQKPKLSVDLYDPVGVAGGTSGMASGLLHPFPGKEGKRSWRADEGMQATQEMIHVAERALGRPVAAASGILRPAVSEQQREDFRKQGEWWEADEVQRRVPGAAAVPGLWIPEGETIFTALYLQGIWLDCERRGAKLIRKGIQSLSELKSYDLVLVATGFQTLNFPECAHLPLKKTPGQILTCRWTTALPFSLVSLGHIALTERPEFCRLGSTYEHGDTLSEHAEEEIKQKVALFYPPALDFEVVETKSGVRLSPKEGYRPIVEKVGEKIWVFTGLGSRGMLYHALLAKELINQWESLFF